MGMWCGRFWDRLPSPIESAMGFEYKIAFRVADPAVMEGFLEQIRRESPASEFEVVLEPDGFYFCDHTKSDRSCRAFRRLVDEALVYSKVVVQEFFSEIGRATRNLSSAYGIRYITQLPLFAIRRILKRKRK